MSEDLERPRSADLLTPILPVLVMVAVMWASEIVDLVTGGRLDGWGIQPRELGGLTGIPLAPFLHGGFGHLLANTFPFVILGAIIAGGSNQRFWTVTVVVGAIGGLGTWLIGPARSVHIGASGLVFGYLTYLLSRGFFARKISYLLGGAVIFFIYGSILWGLLPRPGISWQGHLFGAAGGVAAAWLIYADRGTEAI